MVLEGERTMQAAAALVFLFLQIIEKGKGTWNMFFKRKKQKDDDIGLVINCNAPVTINAPVVINVVVSDKETASETMALLQQFSKIQEQEKPSE